MTRPGSHGRKGVAFTANLATPRFNPARDRQVNSRVVPCPICHAEVGSSCVTSSGREVAHVHRARRRIAIRQENKEL